MSRIAITHATPDELSDALSVIHASFATLGGKIDPPSAALEETTESLLRRIDRGGAVLVARDAMRGNCWRGVRRTKARG
ncbi:MAG: hypothetical protein HQ481_01025 [Alphaproteobacteria bacterium]|nr:hypothetical protein [Alphaproteobacteria bacterium]